MQKAGRGFKAKSKGCCFTSCIERVVAPSLLQNVKIYLTQKKQENSRTNVYAKTRFGSESPWITSHWRLGKYCFEILLHICLAYTILPLHLPVFILSITQSCSQGHYTSRSKSTSHFPHLFSIKSSNWRHVWHKLDKNGYYPWFLAKKGCGDKTAS